MAIRRVTRIHNMRGDVRCLQCGADVKELFRQGKAVYGKTSGTRRDKYYCSKCKADIFGGVKLRNE